MILPFLESSTTRIKQNAICHYALCWNTIPSDRYCKACSKTTPPMVYTTWVLELLSHNGSPNATLGCWRNMYNVVRQYPYLSFLIWNAPGAPGSQPSPAILTHFISDLRPQLLLSKNQLFSTDGIIVLRTKHQPPIPKRSTSHLKTIEVLEPQARNLL